MRLLGKFIRELLFIFLLLFVLGFSNVSADEYSSDIFFDETDAITVVDNFNSSEVFFGGDNVKTWAVMHYTQFEPSKGDYFLVDIEAGRGYLVNEYTRIYTSFPVMTGGLRTPTPERDWTVLTKHIQRDRVTFSESGEFLRLYMNDGATFTHYGIHGYGYFDYEMERETKYLSLGCILVADDVLDLIEDSWRVNDESLRVSTRAQVRSFEW